MYARTVSRSTEESTGPVMSKKPPIVILPPLTPPEPPPLVWVDPGALGIAAGLAPDWAPDTSPCCTKAVEAGWVYDRIVVTPNTAAMTTAAPRREAAMLSLKPRDMSLQSLSCGFLGR